MRALMAALGFLTILPVGRGAAGLPAPSMLPWFPVAGLIVGGLWLGFDQAVGRLLPSALRAVLDMGFVVVLTGGLHLDGLADTADGLLSHRGRQEALRIMKDSRIGTWGVLALLFVLGTKTLALHELLLRGEPHGLVLVPVYGRAAMLAGIFFLPYGRGEEGIGSLLFERSGRQDPWVKAGIVLLLAGSVALLGRGGAVALNAAFLGGVALVLLAYRSRMGCVTGDMLGALGEITETILLVVLAAGAS
ncbi:MAG: adenosylcobinamide-GDP ribazoletransferase [bacterium]